MIRCRMPPENSCGYWLVAGRRDAHRRAAPRARARAISSLREVRLVRLERLLEVLARSASAGSAGSSAPGRSSRAPGRAGRAARLRRAASRRLRPSEEHLAVAAGAARAAGRAGRGRGSTCRSPTRRPGRAVSPGVEVEADAVDGADRRRASVPYQTRRSRTREDRLAQSARVRSTVVARRSARPPTSRARRRCDVRPRDPAAAQRRVERLVEALADRVSPVTSSTIARPGKRPVHQMPAPASSSARWRS